MKLSLVTLLLAVGTALGAEKGLISQSRDAPDSIVERRAEAMGSEHKRFETMRGRVYRDMRITEINDGGISFTHADGAGRLRYEDLSPQQRRYFGIAEDPAAEIYRKEREARLAYEKKVEKRQAARKKEAEARFLAAEKAAKKRAEKAEAAALQEIPVLPEIIPVSVKTRHVGSGRVSRRGRVHYRPSYHYSHYYHFRPHYYSQPHYGHRAPAFRICR
jgi:hypothetical protein